MKLLIRRQSVVRHRVLRPDMKKKRKSFFSKYHLVLIISFLVIGTLFTHPITVYSTDSNYLRHDNRWFDIINSGTASHRFYVKPDENLEILAFSEKGSFDKSYLSQYTWKERPSEFRVSGKESGGKDITWMPQYHLAQTDSPEDPFRDSTGFSDYVGIIIKKDGVIVSASLYKLFCTTNSWRGIVKEIAVLEYPVLNFLITETHVKSELRRIALIDRVITLDSQVDRQSVPENNTEAYFDYINQQP